MQYLRQNCCPKVISVVLLSKARARNDTNARVLQQIKSIKNIRGLVRFTGCLYRLLHEDELKLFQLRFSYFLRNLDLREGVHGPLDGVAGEARDCVECGGHQPRPRGQAAQHSLPLRQPGVVTLLTWPRVIHHNVHTRLTSNV